MPSTRSGTDTGLSEYENQRNERIRANEQTLAELGILDAVKAAKNIAPKDGGTSGRKRRRRNRLTGSDAAWDCHDSEVEESDSDSDDEGVYFGDELVTATRRKAAKRRLKASRRSSRAQPMAPRPSRAAAKAAAVATRTAFAGDLSDEDQNGSDDGEDAKATHSDKESDFSAADSSSETSSESSASESEDKPLQPRRRTRRKTVASDDEEVEEYEVEKVVDMRFQGDDTEYRVRWAGWPSSADTWESEENLRSSVPEMITQYHHGARG